MLALIKQFLPQIFVAIIYNEKSYKLKITKFRGKKALESISKEFDKDEKLLSYLVNLAKKFRFHYFGFFLESPEQGVMSIKDELNLRLEKVENISIKTLSLGGALLYTATEHVDYYEEFFAQSGELDFLYSPLAILYFLAQKQSLQKPTLCVYKHEKALALMICESNKILIGDFKYFEEESGIELDENFSTKLDFLDDLNDDQVPLKDESKEPSDDLSAQQNESDLTNELESDSELSLDNYNEELDKQLDKLDDGLDEANESGEIPNLSENNGFGESELKSGESGDIKADLMDLESDLSKDRAQLEELNHFSMDMELVRYIISTIERFYKDERYKGDFIDSVLIFSNEEISSGALSFLESETFLSVQSKSVNSLELMIEMMRGEER